MLVDNDKYEYVLHERNFSHLFLIKVGGHITRLFRISTAKTERECVVPYQSSHHGTAFK